MALLVLVKVVLAVVLAAFVLAPQPQGIAHLLVLALWVL